MLILLVFVKANFPEITFSMLSCKCFDYSETVIKQNVGHGRLQPLTPSVTPLGQWCTD